MMIPTIREVMVHRYWMAGLSRFIGVCFMLLSLWPLGSWVTEGIADWDMLWISYYWPRIVIGTGLLIIGFVFIVFNKGVARAFLPIPLYQSCPKCGFSVRGLREARCPECGLVLPEDAITPQAPETNAPPIARDRRGGALAEDV
jgi:hypothetical protein